MSNNSLLDPDNIAGDKYDELNKKLQVANMVLGRSPNKKGFPFIFIFSSTKSHILKEIKIPIYTDDDGNTEYFYTAATDGKNYYWSPQLVERLSPKELAVIMAHETYHVILQHCNFDRVAGKNKKIWNIAVDYVVNSMIEHDARTSWKDMHVHDNYRGKTHPIWQDNLGSPLYFDELIQSIDNEKKALKAHNKANKAAKNGAPQPAPVPQKKKAKPNLKDIKFYADYGQYNKSAEEIYDKIMEHVKDLEEEQLDYILDQLGVPMDEHTDPNVSRQQLLQEVLDAAQATKQLCGTVPGSIEAQLLKLQEPKLSWQDIVRTTLQKKRQEKGSINDWSRFRRRGIPFGLYIPKKKSEYVSWCAFLDTSGSMSEDDMSYCVSQLKCLDGRSEGMVVPNDAQPYWDKAVNIRMMSDLPNINPVGRGGTCFTEIFRDFRKKIPNKNFDVLIVLTDGGIFDLDTLKHPGCDVVWVLCNNCQFKPPFGRVAPLRSF